MELLYRILRVVLLAYVLGAVVLYVFQRSLLYLPTEKVAHAYPVEQFANQGESIDVIVVNAGKPSALLYFGGNADAVAHVADYYKKHLPDYTVYLVNYRGYGGSSGSPSEQGFYADASLIFDNLRPRHQQIIVAGRSLGSGVATYLAAHRAVDKLLLVTPYDSIQAVAQGKYPFYPIAWLLQDKFDSWSRVPQIKAPTLIVLAEQDDLIKAERSSRLIAAFPPTQLQVHTIQGSEHNDIADFAELYLLFQRFVAGK